MILREGVKLTLVGLFVVGLLAAGVAVAMGKLLVGVGKFDPVVLTVAPLFLGIASLTASWPQARRADPG